MSPGVSRPLTARRHFTHAVGHAIVLDRRDGGALSGRLTAVERTGPDDGVLVVVPVTPGLKGRKAVVGEPVRVPLSEVRSAHVEVDLTGVGPVDDDDEAGSDADAGQES